MKRIDIILSLIPIVCLVIFLSIVIRLFGTDALSGASQVALLTSSAVCVAIGMLYYKKKWDNIQSVIVEQISKVGTALVILMFIGALSGVWIISGVVPMMIYYGLNIMSPHFFLVSACVICAVVSVMTGSSWTTIATIGVALLGMGKAQGYGEGLIAGAIISGAYFGDKISPLSDTTVLAASVAETPLFSHIKYMLFTTVPSMVITLLAFTVIGLCYDVADTSHIEVYQEVLASKFNMSVYLLLVPVLTFIMIFRRMPAIIVLFLSTLIAAVFALVFQSSIVTEIGGGEASASNTAVGIIRGIFDTTSVETGNADINRLIATRGMRGMLDTIWLILCAMTFGGSMNACGMLRHITQLFLPLVRRPAGIVTSTVCSGVFFNSVVADQYLSIILSGSIFKGLYSREGYESRLMSRSIEDSCTVTSPLIPWNSCGMTQSSILNVSTFTYFPFCFFNLLSPLMSIIVALTGYKIFRAGTSNSK